MQSDRTKLAPFAAFRPFRYILHIYDVANFGHADRRIVFRNKCLAVVFATMAFCFVVAIGCAIWNIVGIGFALSDIAMPLGILTTSIMFASIYTTYKWKLQLIDGVIDDLVGLIDKREYQNLAHLVGMPCVCE